jgi:hypothetical protein
VIGIPLDARRMVSEMKGTVLSVLASLWCFGMLAGCLSDSTGLQEDPSVWMAVEPIQCLGNSWERDWLAKHDGDYASYPSDLASQFGVIKAYYEDLGVDVRGMASRQKGSIVCCACSCGRGDTLYILVGIQDVEIMENEGFRRENPRMPGPVTRYD